MFSHATEGIAWTTTIVADTMKFGQVGPRVGSVDPPFGTVHLARLVGEKKALELYCRTPEAEERRRAFLEMQPPRFRRRDGGGPR